MAELDIYREVAEFYDHVPEYVTRPDTAFYVNLARQVGGPVLELGSGTGRVLVPTARQGIPITGIDNSEPMLNVCRNKLNREPAHVKSAAQVINADMRSFDLHRRFKLATIPFRPFQHLLTVEDQLACLACIHRHLEPGGTLAMDVFNPDMARLSTPPSGTEKVEFSFALPDGQLVVRKVKALSVNLFEQVSRMELIYEVVHPDGRTERHVQPLDMRYFFRYELEHLLARAGFQVDALYGGFDKQPFGSDYPGELVVVAKRL